MSESDGDELGRKKGGCREGVTEGGRMKCGRIDVNYRFK